MRPLRVLAALKHHRPHESGWTVDPRPLVKRWFRPGPRIAVLKSRYEPRVLPQRRFRKVEGGCFPVRHEVSIDVIPQLSRFSGCSPIRKHEVANVHGPRLDAAPRVRWVTVPVLFVGQWDLERPLGSPDPTLYAALLPLNVTAAGPASHMVVSSEAYALRRHRHETRVVTPLAAVTPRDVHWAAHLHVRGKNHPCIRFAAPFAEGKGAHLFVAVRPSLAKKMSAVRIAFIGAYQDNGGEETHAQHPGPPVVAIGSQREEKAVCRMRVGEPLSFGSRRPLAEPIARVLRNRPFYVWPQQPIQLLFSAERSVRTNEEVLSLVRENQREAAVEQLGRRRVCLEPCFDAASSQQLPSPRAQQQSGMEGTR
ncbi:hypothetical protein HRbin30_01523 [bacterium HR30]|nr:hypothetical protein HRbin30_01523 [bacterium HR30]